jgi:3-oxoacyl-[acyl-carrier protein] reductase
LRELAHSHRPTTSANTSPFLGIGASVVKELAQRGASVAFTYLSSAKAQLMLNELQGSGTKAIAIQADCADAAVSAKKVIKEVMESFGKIDIIVNNAGNGDHHSLLDVTEENFDRIFHINLLFPLLLVQESVPHLQQKARIVNIGSITGRIGKHEK